MMKSLSGIPAHLWSDQRNDSGFTMRDGPCTPCGCQRETGSGRSPLAAQGHKNSPCPHSRRQRSPQIRRRSDQVVHVIGIVRGCSPSPRMRTASWSLRRPDAELHAVVVAGRAPNRFRCDSTILHAIRLTATRASVEIRRCPSRASLHLEHSSAWAMGRCANTPDESGGRSRHLVGTGQKLSLPGEHVAICSPCGSCLRKTTSASPQVSAQPECGMTPRVGRRIVPPAPVRWSRGKSGRKRSTCLFFSPAVRNGM